MREAIERTLFRDPEGTEIGAFWLLLSAGSVGYGAYLHARLDADPTLPVLLGTAIACFGVAESLPEGRARWAGWLRVLGIAVLVSLPFVAF